MFLSELESNSVFVEIHVEVHRWVRFLEVHVLISFPFLYRIEFIMPRIEVPPFPLHAVLLLSAMSVDA